MEVRAIQRDEHPEGLRVKVLRDRLEEAAVVVADKMESEFFYQPDLAPEGCELVEGADLLVAGLDLGVGGKGGRMLVDR